MKCCKTCKHWDRDKARDKGARIRSDRVAPCLFILPKLPESIGSFGSKKDKELRWMAAGYGLSCETHESI